MQGQYFRCRQQLNRKLCDILLVSHCNTFGRNQAAEIHVTWSRNWSVELPAPCLTSPPRPGSLSLRCGFRGPGHALHWPSQAQPPNVLCWRWWLSQHCAFYHQLDAQRKAPEDVSLCVCLQTDSRQGGICFLSSTLHGVGSGSDKKKAPDLDLN